MDSSVSQHVNKLATVAIVSNTCKAPHKEHGGLVHSVTGLQFVIVKLRNVYADSNISAETVDIPGISIGCSTLSFVFILRPDNTRLCNKAAIGHFLDVLGVPGNLHILPRICQQLNAQTRAVLVGKILVGTMSRHE